MIKIAGNDLKTATPKDLNEQLVAATGCSAGEVAKILAAGPARAASALRPFLEADVLPGGELGAAIASDPDALSVIAKLYDGLSASIVPAGEAGE
jgi:hypothetical protein